MYPLTQCKLEWCLCGALIHPSNLPPQITGIAFVASPAGCYVSVDPCRVAAKRDVCCACAHAVNMLFFEVKHTPIHWKFHIGYPKRDSLEMFAQSCSYLLFLWVPTFSLFFVGFRSTNPIKAQPLDHIEIPFRSSTPMPLMVNNPSGLIS